MFRPHLPLHITDFKIEQALIRFFQLVKLPDNPNECWIWRGAKTPSGYGRFPLGNRILGEIYAHRFSYEVFKGDLNADNCLHHCDTTSCVNPIHLFNGDQSDNMFDCSLKGRCNNQYTNNRYS
jgi:hypothetical protein